MQVSCGVYTEVSAQGALWAVTTGLGRSAPVTGRTERMPVEEGHLMPDHVHMLLSIPPKYSVSSVMGFMKGKSAIHIARAYGGRRRNDVGQNFWARGYWISTVGKNEGAVRRSIQT